MHLFEASQQWATRPPDERFSSIEEMLKVCKEYYNQACEAELETSKLKVVADENEVKLFGQTGRESKLTHWAFGQLSQRANAPAHYLRNLPAEIAAECLNYGFSRSKNSHTQLELMFHQLSDEIGQQPLPQIQSSNPLILRAITSNKYKRIWNYEIVEELQELLDKGWRVPPARPALSNQPGTRKATAEDVLRDQGFLSIKEGDLIAPAGLYASDHDMFTFLINENAQIDDGTDGGLHRGIFFENSEVGDKALRCTTFLYRHVCGNHIVWDAEKVKTRTIRHVGKARDKFKQIFQDLKNYENKSAYRDEQKIIKAQKKEIGKDKEETVDKLFTRFNQNISREQLEFAFDYADSHSDTDGSPTTVWGMTQGITRLSQESQFADERTKLDRAAGKVLRIAF